MSQYKPGRYTAKVVEYGVPQLEPNQKPHIVLVFEYEETPGVKKRISAYRYLTGGAVEYTLKDLLTCGLKSNSVSSLTRPEAFWDKEVSIVLEDEEYQGKKRTKVKWINEVGGAKWANMQPMEADAQFAQYDNYIAAMRQEMGKKSADDTGFAPSANDFDPGF